MKPLVSVVIPTYRRPELVQRAVRSALGQTVSDVEVIVVVDGRDAETVARLGELDDARLRVIVPDRHLGNADARNTGVNGARAHWVAFLDDDDEWLPAKLERQLACARACVQPNPVTTCRLLARTEDGTFVWPRRPPRPGEPLSEYFFCRKTPFTGEGMVVNSAVMTTRELATRVPFRSGLARHADPDWLLRAATAPGSTLVLVPGSEPLLVWHIERGRDRITNRRDWEYSLAWARDNRGLFTARGYAAFLLHVVSAIAAAQSERCAYGMLLREALRAGRPAPVDVVAHTGNFLLPDVVQRA
ncbi:MAG: glycosyltransferase family 2 protein, partial [Longimicrobiales bacterium]